MTMKKHFLLALLATSILFGCEDESTPTSNEGISIQFDESNQVANEDDDTEITVTLTLNKAATATGTVTLQIDNTTQARVQTTPAHTSGQVVLPVVKGASQLQFSIKAVNNEVVDGDVVAKIQIKPSSFFTVGERHEFQLTVHDDDEAPVYSTANFTAQIEAVLENSTTSTTYTIQLSEAVATDSKVTVSVTSLNTNSFVTNPAVENGKIILLAPVGTASLSFTLATLNNSEVNGHTEVSFAIISTAGSIVKGTQLLQNLTIKDDELVGKLRGYENNGGVDSEKRFYEYDAKGRISKINWETYTGFTRTGTDTYFYDDEDRLVKINKSPGRDIHYLWSNGRIERAELYQDGVLKDYSNYAYDEAENLAGVDPYHRQQDGSFKRGMFSVYLYFVDGNVYKSLLYQDVAGQEEPVLIRTRTYDQYLPALAPVSMVEIVPGVKSQKNLAGRYREETLETDATYWLTYEMNEEGLPVKRTASSTGNTQTTVYHYY